MIPPGEQAVDFNRLGPPVGAHVVVAGGCGGIGRAVVAAALASGQRVTVLDLIVSHQRHPVPAGAEFLAIDAREDASVAAAFAELGRRHGAIDSLINLVGFRDRLAPISERGVESWDEIVAGNLRSAFLICKAALPLLGRHGGTIVNVASGLALRVLPGYAPYAASKAGVIALTKALAVENAPLIRANVVAPGAVRTAFLAGGTGRVEDEAGDWDAQYAAYIKAIPLARLGEVEDVVGPILFLAGPASRYMTGQVLYINGGGLTP
ncbi:MAG: SDR family oxidoreductase [Alphaproteobacteria bacterium]|nr:SDR family oxidoreductase [Alphaproteobacteria bacterium]